MRRPLLEVEHVSVRYAGSRRFALRDVALTLGSGETIGLLGHNGSGKSTLVKVLAGVVHPEGNARGTFKGEALRFPVDALWARRNGLVFVHQDLGLVPGMSVLENICVGDYDRYRLGVINRKAAKSRVDDVLDELGLRVSADSRIEGLGPGDRVLVAIARALDGLKRKNGSAGVLVLDEATAGLHIQQRETVLNAVSNLTRDGLGIVMVTHKLDEIGMLCSRAVVLRDGELIADTTLENGRRGLDVGRLSRLIRGDEIRPSTTTVVGRRGSRKKQIEAGSSSSTVELIDIGCSESVSISLSTDGASIVGLTGLPDSGVLDVSRAMSGDITSHGKINVGGICYDLRTPESEGLLRNVISFVPSDRRDAGLALQLSAEENLCVVHMNKFTRRFGIFNKSLSAKAANEVISYYSVHGAAADTIVGQLSGGNQQKLLLGKWIQLGRPLMVIDEPTQGVDVGARADIYDILRATAHEAGTTVIVVSTDIRELVELCDSVAVVRDGSCAAVLTGPDISESNIRNSL